MAGPCPTPEQLAFWSEGRLAPEAAAAVSAHVSGCASCGAAAGQAATVDSGRTLPSTARAAGPAVTDAPPDYQPVLDADGHPVELGRGGIGRVVLMTDGVLGRDVAMKELLPQHARATGAEAQALEARFLREARVTGQLEHPAIVPVYALGRHADGRLFYTMRRVRGRTLAAAIAGAPTLAERLTLMPHFLAACQAVAFAHSRGVVHRDLKPQNVMFDRFGETSVLDWGLASVRSPEAADAPGVAPAPTSAPTAAAGTLPGDRVLRLAPDLTSGLDSLVVGTPAYMSPEQASGRIAHVTARSDVWGLGAVLFELLTRRPPRQLQPGFSTEALVREPVPEVTALEPAAPPELAAICRKSLALDPADRYPSAEALAADVDAWVHGRPVGAYEYRAVELLGRLARRHAAPLTVALLGLLLAAGLAVTGWRRTRAERNESRALAQLMFGETARKLALVPGSMPEVEAVTRRALAFYERLLAEGDATAEERLQMAAAVSHLLQLNNSLARWDESERLVRICEQLGAETLALDAPRPDALAYAVNCQTGLAILAKGRGQKERSSAALGEAERRTRRGDEAWLDEVWVASHSALLTMRFQDAYQAGQLAEAEAAAMHEVRYDEAIAAKAPGRPNWARNLSSSLRDLALVSMATGAIDAGLAAGERSVEVLRHDANLARNSGALAMLAAALTQQAQFAALTADEARARVLQVEAVDTYERLLRLEPQLIEPRADFAVLLLRTGDAPRALSELERVEAAIGTDPSLLAMAALFAGRRELTLSRQGVLEKDGRHSGLWVLAVALALEGRPADGARAARLGARDTQPFIEWPSGAVHRLAASTPGPLGPALEAFAADYEAMLARDDQDWPAVLQRLASSLDALASADAGPR